MKSKFLNIACKAQALFVSVTLPFTTSFCEPYLKEPQNTCGSTTQHSFPGPVSCALSVILSPLDTFHYVKLHPGILNNVALPGFCKMNGDTPFTMNSSIILYAKPYWSATVFCHLPYNLCVFPYVGFISSNHAVQSPWWSLTKSACKEEVKWPSHSFINRPFSPEQCPALLLNVQGISSIKTDQNPCSRCKIYPLF